MKSSVYRSPACTFCSSYEAVPRASGRGGNIAGSVCCDVPCGRHMHGNDQREPDECSDVPWCRVVQPVHMSSAGHVAAGTPSNIAAPVSSARNSFMAATEGTRRATKNRRFHRGRAQDREANVLWLDITRDGCTVWTSPKGGDGQLARCTW